MAPTAKRAARPATRPLQLRYLAHARSGDKGNTANVGLIALDPAHAQRSCRFVPAVF